MYECIGIENRKGSFTDDKGKNVEYDNIMFSFVTDENPNVLGYQAAELKIGRSKVETINFRDWTECVGKEINFIYALTRGTPVLSGVKIVGEGKVVKVLTGK